MSCNTCTLHENTLACDIILVARQHITCVWSYSDRNSGKEREMTLLMRCLATKLTSLQDYFHVIFSRYNESVNKSRCFIPSAYIIVKPEIEYAYTIADGCENSSMIQSVDCMLASYMLKLWSTYSAGRIQVKPLFTTTITVKTYNIKLASCKLQHATASCKAMGGATSMMPVTRGTFTQWADTIDLTVHCDWLQVASVVTCSLQLLTFILQVLLQLL